MRGGEAGDRASVEDREPRAKPNGNRDDRKDPIWQTVHGAMSPVVLTEASVPRIGYWIVARWPAAAFALDGVSVGCYAAPAVSIGPSLALPSLSRLAGFQPVDAELYGGELARSPARANRRAWGARPTVTTTSHDSASEKMPATARAPPLGRGRLAPMPVKGRLRNCEQGVASDRCTADYNGSPRFNLGERPGHPPRPGAARPSSEPRAMD